MKYSRLLKTNKPPFISSRFSGADSLGFFQREPFHRMIVIPVLQVFTQLRNVPLAYVAFNIRNGLIIIKYSVNVEFWT